MNINKYRQVVADWFAIDCNELNEFETQNGIKSIDDCVRILSTYLNSLEYRSNYLSEKTAKARKNLTDTLNNASSRVNGKYKHKLSNTIIEVMDEFDGIDIYRQKVVNDVDKIRFVMDKYLDITDEHAGAIIRNEEKVKACIDRMMKLCDYEIVKLNIMQSGENVLKKFCDVLNNTNSTRNVNGCGDDLLNSTNNEMYTEISQRMMLFREIYGQKLNSLDMYSDEEQLSAYVANGYLLCSRNGKAVFMKDTIFNRNRAIVELMMSVLRIDAWGKKLYGLNMDFAIRTLSEVLNEIKNRRVRDGNAGDRACSNSDAYIGSTDKSKQLSELMHKIEDCKEEIEEEDVMSLIDLLKIETPEIRCVVNNFANSKYTHLFSKKAYVNVRRIVGEIVIDMENEAMKDYDKQTWDSVIDSVGSEMHVEICVVATMVCTIWCDVHGSRCDIDSETMRKVIQAKIVITRWVKLLCIITPMMGWIWMVMRLRMHEMIKKSRGGGVCDRVVGNSVIAVVIGMLMTPYAMMCGMMNTKERRGMMRDDLMGVLAVMLAVIVGMKYMGNVNTSNVYDGIVMGGMLIAGLLRMAEITYGSNCMFVHEMNVKMLRIAVVVMMAVGVMMLENVFEIKRNKRNGVMNGILVFVMMGVTVMNDVMQTGMVSELHRSALEIIELCI